MEIKLKFEPDDFKDHRTFEKAVVKQIGNNVYVGTNNICLYFDFPKGLADMLRPLPENKQYEFTLTSSKPDAKK